MALGEILTAVKARRPSQSAVAPFNSASAPRSFPSQHLPHMENSVQPPSFNIQSTDYDMDGTMDADKFLSNYAHLLTPAKHSAPASPSQPRQHRPESDGGVPVPLAGPSSAGHVSILYNLCTLRRLDLEFQHKPVGPSDWTGRLIIRRLSQSVASFSIVDAGPPEEPVTEVECHDAVWEVWDDHASTGTLVIQRYGPFASKKASKEHVAEIACSIISTIPLPSKRPRVSEDQGTESADNYIGILLEYYNSINTPHPEHQDYQVGGQSFACTLTLRERPGHVFGGLENHYSSKKAAKKAAAQEAVEWLRTTETWQEQEKKKESKKARARAAQQQSKKSKMEPSSLESPAPGTTQDGMGYGEEAMLQRDTADCNAMASSQTGTKDISNREATGRHSSIMIVNELCQAMKLDPPSYVITPHDNTVEGMVGEQFRCHAVFHTDADAMPESVGEVHHVIGRRRAKEECAKKVVQALMALNVHQSPDTLQPEIQLPSHTRTQT